MLLGPGILEERIKQMIYCTLFVGVPSVHSERRQATSSSPVMCGHQTLGKRYHHSTEKSQKLQLDGCFPRLKLDD